MRIAVIGAAGIQAKGTVQDLLEFGSPEEIVMGDVSGPALERRLEELSDDRLTGRIVDLQDAESLRTAVGGCDVTIMSGPSAMGLGAMPVVLEAGSHYVDLGASPTGTMKQLEMHDLWAESDRTAVLGAGSAPGISNVMARLCVERLDTVRDIEIYIAMRDATPRTSPLHWPFDLDAILDEYTLPAVAIRDGQEVQIPPRTSTSILLEEPIGESHPVFTSHPEQVTLFHSYKDRGCRNTTFSIALPETFHRKISMLVELGLADRSTIDIGGIPVVPRDLFLALCGRIDREEVEEQQYSATRVVARGERDGTTREIVADMYVSSNPKWNLPAGVVKTAIPPSIVAQMIVSGTVSARGVFPPERSIPTIPFFTELAKREMRVEVRETEYAHTLS